MRFQAVAEEGVLARDIAHAIARGLKVPVVSKSVDEAAAYFGWLAMFAGLDPCASAAQTATVGMASKGPGLIADLDHMRYFEPEQTAHAAALRR